MNYFFITGTSRGIGRSLTEELLKDERNFVYGFSRTNNLHHPRFAFFAMDFSEIQGLHDFIFPETIEPQSIHLINNAGMIGDVNHFGHINPTIFEKTHQVNFLAPCLMMNQFTRQFASWKGWKTIVNISSGAASYPIDAWGAYCSSKAALEMAVRVFNLEQEMTGGDIRAFAVAPGIVNTRMQDEIRGVSPERFLRVKDFIAYKDKNELVDPVQVAEKMVRLIYKERRNINPIFSLRDFS